jgi:hypothetical protein
LKCRNRRSKGPPQITAKKKPNPLNAIATDASTIHHPFDGFSYDNRFLQVRVFISARPENPIYAIIAKLQVATPS